ncbi:MAG: aspartate/glutamate racemase family protein [Desulfotignum sp.]|nr:aspartate/glutamate racemase family protein [Desulfotignum sp.]
MTQSPFSPAHTIVVTDSGLGGLSVYAAIAAGLSQTDVPGSGIHLIYVNAWPETDKGYNHYPDMTRKAAVFDQALAAMAALNPDALVIACNTLSVIYPCTEFSKTTRMPVHDIIDQGVRLAADTMNRNPETGVILFGTPTTADSQIHARRLIGQGMAPDRIITQGCTGLAGIIERNPFDPEINNRIQDNVDQAMAKGANRFQQIAAALCCTHFGYCRDQFASAITRHTGTAPKILDPNQDLAAKVVTATQNTLSATPVHDRPITKKPTSRTSSMNLQILSRVLWEPERIQAYATLFESPAPRVAEALKNYQYHPDLFHIPEPGDPST